MEGDEQRRASQGGMPRAKMPPMLYQNEYVWFVFLSTLDVMLTWAILRRGGTEVNPVARLVIDEWGLSGAIVFKFALVLFVIVVCEHVGRQRPRTGVSLARLAVIVSALPPLWSLGLLVVHTFKPEVFA